MKPDRARRANINKRRICAEEAVAEIHREAVRTLEAERAYDRTTFNAFLFDQNLHVAVPPKTTSAWIRGTARLIVVAFRRWRMARGRGNADGRSMTYGLLVHKEERAAESLQRRRRAR
jgi:hypothetical protein